MTQYNQAQHIDCTGRGLLIKSVLAKGVWLLVLLILAVFVAAVYVPLAWVSGMSIFKAGLWFSGAGFKHYTGLLAKSFLLTSVVGIFSVVVSLPASSVLARGKGIVSDLFRAFFVFPLLIPSYVYAYSWELIFGGKGISLTGGLIGAGGFSAFVLTIAVCTMRYCPISAAILAAGYRQLNCEMLAQASMEAKPLQISRYITLPLLRPFVLAAFLCSSLLTLGDYSIPHLFGANIYATEALAEYQANINASRLAGFGFPSLLVGILVFTILSIQLRGSGRYEHFDNDGNKAAATTSQVSLWRYVSVFTLCLVTIGLPLYFLANDIRGLGDLKVGISDYSEELTASGLISFVSALAILAIAIGITELTNSVFAEKKPWLGRLIQRVFICTCLAGTVLPAAVIGAGLVGIYNRGGVLGYLYDSPWIVGLGNLVRFASLGFLVVYLVRRTFSRRILEAACVDGADLWQRFRRIVLPLSIVPLLILGCLIFFLCFSELPLTSILLPAGLANFPMTLMNHMHYGRTGSVSSICLAMAAVVLVLLALWLMVNRRLSLRSFNRIG